MGDDSTSCVAIVSIKDEIDNFGIRRDLGAIKDEWSLVAVDGVDD